MLSNTYPVILKAIILFYSSFISRDIYCKFNYNKFGNAWVLVFALMVNNNWDGKTYKGICTQVLARVWFGLGQAKLGNQTKPRKSKNPKIKLNLDTNVWTYLYIYYC
jgi:hypothetical protein